MLARRVFADGRRAPTPGAAAPRARISPRSASACSRCPASSSSGGSRGPRTSSTSSMPSPGTTAAAARRRAARAGASSAAAGAHDELTRDAAAAEARLAELRALVEDTRGPRARDTRSKLRAERERLRHVTELAEGAAAAGAALAPDDGEGAAGLVAVAERAVAPLERLAPELAAAGDDAPRRRAAAARDGLASCARSSPRSRPSRAGSSSSRPSSTGSPTRSAASARDLRGAARPRRRGPRRAGGDRRRARSAPARGRRARRRRGPRSPRSHAELAAARERAAAPFADGRRPELARHRPRRGRVPASSSRPRPGPGRRATRSRS